MATVYVGSARIDEFGNACGGIKRKERAGCDDPARSFDMMNKKEDGRNDAKIRISGR